MKKLLAALIFFTRLPFYRLVKLPSDCFSHVVPYWPLTGWLTGGIMAATLWLAAQIFPLQIAWCMAIAVRLFVTGCLHEDGLADFFDGFGGGTTRERTLAIMKDSHIGTYAVVALLIYFLLLSQMYLMPLEVLCAVVFCADTYTKSCVAQIINLLPYSRKEEDSKTRKLYARMTASEIVISVGVGFLPVCVLLPVCLWWACLAPIVVFAFLCMLMKKRIGGYTGDCCGAAFLLCELSFYLAAFALVLKLY